MCAVHSGLFKQPAHPKQSGYACYAANTNSLEGGGLPTTVDWAPAVPLCASQWAMVGSGAQEGNCVLAPSSHTSSDVYVCRLTN